MKKVLRSVKKTSLISYMIPAGILVFAAFLRLYRFPLRFGFDYDALRDSLLIRYASWHFQIPLIGPPTSVGDFPHGPWYYYVLIIGEMLFRTVYAPWIAMILVSLVSIFVFYLIGKSFGSRFFGAVLAILVALSASQITLATGLTNTNTIFFCTAVVIYISLLLIKKGYSSRLIFLLGLVLSIGFFSHDEMVSIFFLPPILLFGYRKKILPSIGWFVLGAAIPAIPILLFDMQHGFLITTRALSYLLHGSTSPMYFPNSWKIYLLSFWPSFFGYTIGVSKIVGLVSALIVIVILLVEITKRTLPKGVLFVLLAFLVNFLLYRYITGGERVIYHTYFLQPFLFFLVGYAFYRIYMMQRVVGSILIVIFLGLMLPFSLKTLDVSSSHIAYEKFAASLEGVLNKKDVTMYYCSGAHKYQTYSVVFTLVERHMIGHNMKLGLQSYTCQMHGKVMMTKEVNGAQLQVVDLSTYSDGMLHSSGWVSVTPQTIYDSVIHAYDTGPTVYKELHIQ